MLAKKRTQHWLCSLFVLPRRTRTVSSAMWACAKRAPAELCAEGASPAGARRIHKIRTFHFTMDRSDFAFFYRENYDNVSKKAGDRALPYLLLFVSYYVWSCYMWSCFAVCAAYRLFRSLGALRSDGRFFVSRRIGWEHVCSPARPSNEVLDDQRFRTVSRYSCGVIPV